MTLFPIIGAVLLATSLQQAPPPTSPPTKPPPPAAATAAALQLKGLPALALQVSLDRAGFSPGVIDGRPGGNTAKALDAYRTAHGGEPPATEPLSRYTIGEADIAGPFEPAIPSDLVEQAKLKALNYKDPVELLAERYHASPALLQRLNPGAKFAAGEEIVVPNVDPMVLPAVPAQSEKKPSPADRKAEAAAAQAAADAKPAVTVTVRKSTGALTVTDAAGKVIMHAPVTTGSEHDPLPLGKWKVNGVGLYPEFRYNPDLFWDADPKHTKALVPSGPNNPVGLVWIDISKEHYGLHGTPEPASIGRSQSHGCVRLTNWDALRLAALVKPGTPVLFES